jgi:hypothetical protein
MSALPMTFDVTGGAAFSPCETWRYGLWRYEGDLLTPGERSCLFVMLNPSTADDRVDDPTIRRCRNFAKGWGYSYTLIANVFAYRATVPADLFRYVRGDTEPTPYPPAPDRDRTGEPLPW